MIFKNFIARMTVRPSFLDNHSLREQFNSLPEFVQEALRANTLPPSEVLRSLVLREDRLQTAPNIIPFDQQSRLKTLRR